MAKVETYSSLEEKGNVFEQITIKSRDELDQIIIKYNDARYKNDLVFRGCNKAYYKLFNSAQRQWISLELSHLGISYDGFIKTEIQNAKQWQNNLLENFYTAFGQPVNDILILGFLQHYGAPTPLLDWTYSFDNSLFFATDDLKYAESDNEIVNYFSIYVIDTTFSNSFNYIEYLIGSSKYLEHIKNELTDENKREVLVYQRYLNQFNYQDLVDISISLIPGYQKNGLVYENNELSLKLFYNQQNLNIINQQGLFISNASKDKPLEYFFRGEKFFEDDYPIPLDFPKIKCLDIHKSLLEYTINYLNDCKPFPINKEFLFPQEEFIAKNSFRQFLNFDFLKT